VTGHVVLDIRASTQRESSKAPPLVDALPSSTYWKPVFGLNLDQLYKRDGTPVPMVVHQCIQAIDLFGMDRKAIYLEDGSQSHVDNMKFLFNTGMTRIIPRGLKRLILTGES